jgi:hypothetical protein
MDTNGGIATFLAEVSNFEKISVRSALRSLSKNDDFALKAEHLLDLDARLRLIKRMAFVRNLDRSDCNEIARIEMRTMQLAAKRNELVHVQDTGSGLSRGERETLRTVWKPTTAEIDQCRKELSDIGSALKAIVDRLE